MNKPELEKATSDISIAALRSWLKGQGLAHTAGSRKAMVARIAKLLDQGKLLEGHLENGLIGIEESSSKRVYLYSLSDEVLPALQDEALYSQHVHDLQINPGANRVLAPQSVKKPALVYLTRKDGLIRAKWAEPQKKVEPDYVHQQFKVTPCLKVIILVADTASGLVQLRFDKPEKDHLHLDDDGNPSSTEYLNFYRQRATAILGEDFTRLDIGNALKRLVETTPRIVRVESKSFRTGFDSKVRFSSSEGDVRDDDDWKAMHDEGGTLWAYEQEFVHWLPGPSGGRLNREVFSAIYARLGMVRVEADCHEGELDYAISQTTKN